MTNLIKGIENSRTYSIDVTVVDNGLPYYGLESLTYEIHRVLNQELKLQINKLEIKEEENDA